MSVYGFQEKRISTWNPISTKAFGRLRQSRSANGSLGIVAARLPPETKAKELAVYCRHLRLQN
jgi:hypothetical protein